MTSNPSHGLEALLDFLKRNRGFDFTGYKRTSLTRRIDSRMRTVNINSYSDYIDYLEVHPEEFTSLFNTILINVTGFFRDQPAWDFLAQEVIPNLVEKKRTGEMIRVWSSGCASGEEAYSLAMLLAEALGEERYEERVKIFATDVDEDALSKARPAIYTEKDMEGVPENLRARYFVRNDDTYTFNKELRRSIIFGRNDLVQNAPISHVDLLVCRNTLMYFNTEAQSRILSRFHFALNDSGYLFLGKAEMLVTLANIFSPIDLKLRIFTKIPRVKRRDRMLMMNNNPVQEEVNQLFNLVQVRDSAFETSPIAQVIIDLNNTLILANGQGRALFNLDALDLGRPFQDLELSYRPLELRSSLEKVLVHHQPLVLKDVDWPGPGGEKRVFDVRIQPLYENGNSLLGHSIAFTDVTKQSALQKLLEQANNELETALEELQSTNEELETMNEELQSTIEELETTNEELQSTNEELETMNEELQSSNEELHTVNDELKERTEEINRVNVFMQSILASVRSGVVVLDKDLRVQIWNRKAEDLWGLHAEEVQGQYFLNLDFGLPLDGLTRALRSCLNGEADFQEVTLAARNRRGRDIQCHVVVSPLFVGNRSRPGLIVVFDEIEPDKIDKMS